MKLKELKVGIIVLLALTSFFVAFFLIKDLRWDSEGQEFVVQFKFLNNLMVGGHVKLNGGIKVGKITKLSHGNKMGLVHIIIFEDTIGKMIATEKLTFSISSAGMLGEKYILILFDDNKGKRFERDENNKLIQPATMAGQESANLEDVITKLSSVADVVEELLNKQVAGILDKINSPETTKIIYNLVIASDNLAKLMENSNLLISDLKDRHMNETFKTINTTIRSTNNEIQAISKNVKSLIYNTNNGITTLFNLNDGLPSVTREGKDLLKNVNEFVTLAKQIVSNLDDVDTPMGALIKDKKVASDLKKVIHNLNKLTEELKDSPLLSDKRKYHPGPF